jgi:FixJ family two-component response regulator
MEKHRIVVGIVDDDQGMRDSLEQLISVFGYRTEVYSSAEEFVCAAPTTEASCIVIDIQLGDASGVELARHLSATGLYLSNHIHDRADRWSRTRSRCAPCRP